MVHSPSLRALSRALLLTLLTCLTFTSVASADRNFSVRFTTNDTGDISGIANTLMTCPAGSTASGVSCATTQGVAPSATTNVSYNNNYDMTYVDIDSDASTFNSSSANQSLPAGAQILFAGLYWGGDFSTGSAAAPNAAARNTVRLKVPGSSTYTTFTADTLDDSTLNVGRYQAFKNITSTIQALPNAGNGTYTAANVQAGRGSDHYAGWTLIVAYRDTTQPARNLTVFDGLRTIRTTDPPTDIPVSGFLTPPAGQVKTNIGFVTWEGDHGITGDTASLNGNVLSDAQHPATNFFNSRISRDGALNTDRSPAYANTMGMDVAFTKADGFIGNSATSATVRVTTSGDQYLPGVITFATEIYAPKIEQTKTVVDDNGGDVEQGDVLTYTVSGVNNGQDGTANFVLRDPIPANTNYVPGSIVLGGTSTTAGAVTDATGDDRGEYDAVARRVVARLGTGANATTGGNVAPTRTYSVTFKVRVNGPALADDPVPAGTVITNTATSSFASQTTNTPLTATSSVSRTVKSPDLRITKTRTGNPIVAGGTSQYTIAVDNITPSGNAPTKGEVTVSDTLPTGITATAFNAPGWTCPAVPTGTITCTRSDALASGASYPPIVVTVSIGQGVSGNVSNTATVSGGGDPLLGNNSSTDTSPSSQIADLALTKTASKAALKIGENVVFTLTARNNGQSTATSVTITDELPAGLTFVSSTPACVIDPVSGVLSCPVGTLAPGATATVEVTAKAMASGATQTLRNVASVAGQQTDPTPGNNTADASVSVLGTDLAVTKTLDGPASPKTGDTVTYTVKVDNLGASDATGVVLLDALPDGLTGVTTDGGAACTVSGTQLTCAVGDIAAGGSYTVKVSGTIQAGTTSLTNAASATGNEPDPDTTNNSAQVTTPVTAASADLSLVKRAEPAQVAPGGTIDYFFVTTNNGPDTANSVTVTDVLPAGVTFVMGAPGCNENPVGTVTCSYAQPILPGTSRQTGFTVRVSDSATGTIRNTATVGSPTADPDPSNNTSTVDTPLIASADVSIVKTVDDATPASGDVITYTLKATNDGPATARDVVLRDTLPPGVTFVSADAPCTETGGVVRCEIGSIPAGGSESRQIKVRVNTIAAGGSTSVHQLDVQKVETQMDLDPGQQRTVSVSCPSGYLVTDGSGRIDAVDQGTGTLASPKVLESRASGTGSWQVTVRNDAAGRAQVKVFAVCVSERTSQDQGHSHELVYGDPVTSTQTLAAGRNNVTLDCGPGKTPIQPGYRFQGDATLLTSFPQGASSWTFAIDSVEGTVATFSIRCLSNTVSSADGHTHPLNLKLLRKDIVVGPGQTVEVQLDCDDDAKGIVGGYDVDPGLVPLGNDPRPKTRSFKFFNPTGQSLNASVSLLCLSTKVSGSQASNTIDNTAYVTSSTPDADLTDNDSTVRVTASSARRASLASTKVRIRGTVATVTVRCAKGRTICRGPVRLVARSKQKLGGKLVKKGTILASTTYTVKAGKTAKVKLKASKVGKKALKSKSLRRAQIRLGSTTRSVNVSR